MKYDVRHFVSQFYNIIGTTNKMGYLTVGEVILYIDVSVSFRLIAR